MPKGAPCPSPLTGKGKGTDMWAGSDWASRPMWSCKIVVQADALHPDFPIVQKIVGNEGTNVEHIRQQTGCTVQLHGLRSATIEPDGQEMQEPMFLSLLSEDPMNGGLALDMAQDLLKSVYDDHATWCQQRGLGMPPEVRPTIYLNEGSVGPPIGSALAQPGPPPLRDWKGVKGDVKGGYRGKPY